jgi:hypothetical protein
MACNLPKRVISVLVFCFVLSRALAPAATIQLPKTGQSTCYDASGNILSSCNGTGQDGDKQKGIGWPNPRFTDNMDGTITDNLTGLIWLKDANCFSAISWSAALANSSNLQNGQCGLTDGSVSGDWRLPNSNEIESLIDISQSSPALPTNHPFIKVKLDNYYHTSNSPSVRTDYLWAVEMTNGSIQMTRFKNDFSYYVWPVRDVK